MADLKEKCSHCYQTHAVYRCNNCCIGVCHKCFYKIHPKPDSNLPVPETEHTPIPLSPLPSYKRSMICTEHSRPFEYHCATCDKYVCSKCVTEGYHLGHHPVAISTKNEELAETVSRLRNEAGKTLQRLKKSESKVLYLETILKLNCDSTVWEIQSEFERLIGMLHKRRAQLINDVERKYNSDDTAWVKLKIEIGQRIKTVTALYEDAKDAFNDSQCLYDFKDLIRHLETVKDIPSYFYIEDESADENGIRFRIDLDNERENLLRNAGRIEGEIKTKFRLISLNQIPAESLESFPESELINSCTSNSPTSSESPKSASDGDMTKNILRFENVSRVADISRYVDLPLKLNYPFEDQDFEMPYPNFRLPRLHEYVKCVPLSYVPPTSFWIKKIQVESSKNSFHQLINMELDIFCKMSLKLSEHFHEYELVENPKLGDAVCCMYSFDSSPCRGVITGYTRNSEDKNDVQYSVLFVDNGARESFRKEKIRRLPDKYRDLPMQAVFCKLHHVRLAEGEKRNIAEKRLKELIGNGHYYNAMLRILGDPVEIDLMYHVRIKDARYFRFAYQDLIDHGFMSLVRDKNGNE